METAMPLIYFQEGDLVEVVRNTYSQKKAQAESWPWNMAIGSVLRVVSKGGQGNRPEAKVVSSRGAATLEAKLARSLWVKLLHQKEHGSSKGGCGSCDGNCKSC